MLRRRKGITEKKMFGGIAFMHHGNMSCGVTDDRLMVRVGADNYEACLKRKHVREMDFTGRPLKGFIYVMPEGIKRRDGLQRWVETGLSFTKTLPKK